MEDNFEVRRIQMLRWHSEICVNYHTAAHATTIGSHQPALARHD